MDISLSRRVFSLRSPGFYLLIGAFVLTALLIATFTLGLKLWQIGTFVFLAWCPLVFYQEPRKTPAFRHGDISGAVRT